MADDMPLESLASSAASCSKTDVAGTLARENMRLPRAPTQKAAVKLKAVSKKISKSQDGRGKSQISFPAHTKLEDLCEALPLDAFRWAQRYEQRACSTFGAASSLMQERDLYFFSEFSGSGCAEVSLQTVARAVGHRGSVKVSYCADFDAQCRSVLAKSCQRLSNVISDRLCSEQGVSQTGFPKIDSNIR